MLLREALSSKDSAFAKLIRLGKPGHSATSGNDENPQMERISVRRYRMQRKLSPDELAQIIALYETGESMIQIGKKFECHRQTIARQLKKAGVELREQQVRSPDFDRRARALYEQGNSLDEVADMLDVQASTINRAVRAAGGSLRLQRRRSLDELHKEK